MQCHCSIMLAYIYMYDNTLGGGLLMTYLQNTNINDRWLIKRGTILKRFLASAAPARPRSLLHVQWKKEGMAEKLIFKRGNCTVLWNCLGETVTGDESNLEECRSRTRRCKLCRLHHMGKYFSPPHAAREQAYAWTHRR